jgi:hypothetical protein
MAMLAVNCSFNATRTDNCSRLSPNFEDYFYQPLANKAGKMCAYIVVAILALLGNVIVIVIICRNKHLRKAINYFILNMAISDLVTPVIIIPIQLYSLSKGNLYGTLAWPVGGDFGSFLCKLAIFLADSSPVVSIMSLLFMTADRFYAVVFPLKAQRISFKVRLALLASSWLVAFGFFSPYFEVVRLNKKGNDFYCELSWAPTFDHTRSMQIFGTTACVLFIIIPFILLSVMYSVILLILKRQTIAKPQARSVSLRRQRNKRNIVFMALAIVLAFAGCWGPYNGFIFTLTIVWRWKVPSYLAELDLATFQYVTHFLTCINAALNPCIYFVFIQSYRSALKNLICCKPRGYTQRSIFSRNESNLWQGKVKKQPAPSATKQNSCLEKNSSAGEEKESFV